jgi:hypothetical protein
VKHATGAAALGTTETAAYPLLELPARLSSVEHIADSIPKHIEWFQWARIQRPSDARQSNTRANPAHLKLKQAKGAMRPDARSLILAPKKTLMDEG